MRAAWDRFGQVAQSLPAGEVGPSIGIFKRRSSDDSDAQPRSRSTRIVSSKRPGGKQPSACASAHARACMKAFQNEVASLPWLGVCGAGECEAAGGGDA